MSYWVTFSIRVWASTQEVPTHEETLPSPVTAELELGLECSLLYFPSILGEKLFALQLPFCRPHPAGMWSSK